MASSPTLCNARGHPQQSLHPDCLQVCRLVQDLTLLPHMPTAPSHKALRYSSFRQTWRKSSRRRRAAAPLLPTVGGAQALTPVLSSAAWVTSPAPAQNFEDPPRAWILAGCPHAQSPPPIPGPAGFASLGSPQPGGKQGDYRMSGPKWASLGKQALLGQPRPHRQEPS